MSSRRRKDVQAGGVDGSLELLKSICSEAGMKFTRQRLEIFRVISESTDHPSVEEVFERVKRVAPSIALDTVYRTLTALEKHGALVRVQLGTRTRFDPNTELHHHFVCRACNRIDDFSWPLFDQMVLPAQVVALGRIKSTRVEIRGICKDCRDDRKKPGERLK